MSEAIARANCRSDITPAFVREAYSLLRQSIIHVEKDDIAIDAVDEEPAAADAATPAARPMTPAGVDNGQAAPTRRSITYDRYMELVNQLVLKVNTVERDTSQGISREALAQWYLEAHENEIESVQQLHEESDLISRVISKLVKDGYLVSLPVDDAERVLGGPEQVLMAVSYTHLTLPTICSV